MVFYRQEGPPPFWSADTPPPHVTAGGAGRGQRGLQRLRGPPPEALRGREPRFGVRGSGFGVRGLGLFFFFFGGGQCFFFLFFLGVFFCFFLFFSRTEAEWETPPKEADSAMRRFSLADPESCDAVFGWISGKRRLCGVDQRGFWFQFVLMGRGVEVGFRFA